MTGWRVGWLAGPSDISKAVNKHSSHSTSGPTSFVQKGGVAALNRILPAFPAWSPGNVIVQHMPAVFTADFAVLEITHPQTGAEVHGFNVYSNVWDVLSGYDSIVTAMGNDADESLYLALKGMALGAGAGAAEADAGAPPGAAARPLELYRVGDCVAPRKVDMAIHEGYMAGKGV